MRLLERAGLPLHDYPQYLRIIMDAFQFQGKDVVAEIGVGTGATAFSIAHRVLRMVGFDISSPLVMHLQRYARPNLSFVQADACDETFGEKYRGAFDKVLSTETLEHVEYPYLFFRNVYKILKPGGTAAIFFPNVEWHGTMHFRSKHEIENVVQGSGLELLEIAALELTRIVASFRTYTLYKPKQLLRRIRGRRRSEPGGSEAQKFDDTFCFGLIQGRRRWWHSWVNVYWGLLLLVESLLPSVYVKTDVQSTVNRRILLLLRKER